MRDNRSGGGGGGEDHRFDPNMTLRITTGLNRKKTGYLYLVYQRNLYRIALKRFFGLVEAARAWRTKEQQIAYYSQFIHEMLDPRIYQTQLENVLKYGIAPDDCLAFQRLYIIEVPKQRMLFLRHFGHLPTSNYFALGDYYKTEQQIERPVAALGGDHAVDFAIAQEKRKMELRGK